MYKYSTVIRAYILVHDNTENLQYTVLCKVSHGTQYSLILQYKFKTAIEIVLPDIELSQIISVRLASGLTEKKSMNGGYITHQHLY